MRRFCALHEFSGRTDPRLALLRPSVSSSASLRFSHLCDIDDSLGECLRIFLRQVVPDAALDLSVRISAGELVGVRAWFRMRGAVGVALHRDSRYSDGWPRRQSFFQVVKLRLS